MPPILRRKHHGDVLPEGGRTKANIDGDIENGAALAAVMKETGLDPDAFRRYAAHDGQRELSDAFAQGDRDGVFGVPTFIVDGEPFWGNDRVEWIEKKLDGMGLRR